MSRCRGCGAEIIWTTTSNGKKMPVDAEPDPAGDFMLEYARARQPLTDEYYAVHRARWTREPPMDERYTSHYATCPEASSFRGKGKS